MNSAKTQIAPFPFLGIHKSTIGLGDGLAMPAFAGVVKIVSNVGSFIHGDTMIVSPSNSIKTYEGSGSSNVGDLGTYSDIFSFTATNDSDLRDSGSNKVATVT